MGHDPDQRRADTIPELDQKTTGNSPNSRSGRIGDVTHEDAKRMDRRYTSESRAGEGRGSGDSDR